MCVPIFNPQVQPTFYLCPKMWISLPKAAGIKTIGGTNAPVFIGIHGQAQPVCTQPLNFNLKIIIYFDGDKRI
jgi:hypothetical protein